jgi:hypothetical protein
MAKFCDTKHTKITFSCGLESLHKICRVNNVENVIRKISCVNFLSIEPYLRVFKYFKHF